MFTHVGGARGAGAAPFVTTLVVLRSSYVNDNIKALYLELESDQGLFKKKIVIVVIIIIIIIISN